MPRSFRSNRYVYFALSRLPLTGTLKSKVARQLKRPQGCLGHANRMVRDRDWNVQTAREAWQANRRQKSPEIKVAWFDFLLHLNRMSRKLAKTEGRSSSLSTSICEKLGRPSAR